MSIELATTRLSDLELAEHLSDVLDRVAKGERVIIHRAEREIAIIAPLEEAITNRQPSLAPAALGESVFDEEFERDVREYREWANSARFAKWPQ